MSLQPSVESTSARGTTLKIVTIFQFSFLLIFIYTSLISHVFITILHLSLRWNNTSLSFVLLHVFKIAYGIQVNGLHIEVYSS